MALCDPKCIYGTCTAPNDCTCVDGFTNGQHNFECIPTCETDCINGKCIAPNICSCSEGYTFKNGSSTICEPICHLDCKNGKCTAPNKCDCNEGFSLVNVTCQPIFKEQSSTTTTNEYDLSTVMSSTESVQTESIFDFSSTELDGGWVNIDCEDGFLADSDGNCKPFCSVKCENGVCEHPDRCKCNENYEKGIDVLNNWNICLPICSTNAECLLNKTCTIDGLCECVMSSHDKYDLITSSCVFCNQTQCFSSEK